MRTITKKKYLISGVTLLVTLGFLTLAPVPLTHGNDPLSTVEITLLENSPDHLIINYALGDFTLLPIPINNDTYYSPYLGDESNSQEPGAPSLPTICRSIIIPDQAVMTGTVISSTYQDYENILIAPARGDFTHNMNPNDIPYIFGHIYEINDWYPGSLVDLQDPYILRDFRGQVIQVNPFHYNPVNKTLRYYTSLTLEITAQGTGGPIIDPGTPDPISSDFQMIYQRHFLNYEENTPPPDGDTFYTPVSEIGNMLIITYDSFYSTMQPFLTWKNMKGIPTEMINVSSIGTGTATDIDTYIDDYYNTNGLTFVLLVGDIQQIPSLSYGSHASDPGYSYITTDNYPDLFIGRFSAQTTAQLETQVERSIEYERYPLESGTWYHNGTGIASSGGPGDDGEYDWEHMRYIRTDLLGYTYTLVDELYDGSQGGEDAPGSPTASMVATAVNDGRSIINYCGHGGPTSWSTTGFSNTYINNLVNDNQLPYVVCVACNNGEFEHYDTCFAEAWMRATNNGEPTGAIGVYASTQSQSWNPPMDAQDEIVDILVETYPGNIRHTLGALSFQGAMHMIDEYGSSAYDEINTWTVFGDPSLQIRTDTPASLTVTHNTQIPNGATAFNVTVTGVENALCALSQNGILLGASYTDATGSAMITFDPITDVIPVDLVVTAYNKIPYNATILMGDEDPPQITDITPFPPVPVMGDTVNLTCTVTDNGGVDTVRITIRDPENNPTEATMTYHPGTHTYYYSTIYPLPGDYQITIWANDTSGNDITAPVYSLTVHLAHSYTLYQGWNLITVPLEGNYTAESLGQAIPTCTVVSMFNGSSQIFASHVVGTSHDDFPLLAGKGYFVYLAQNTSVLVTGTLLDTLSLPIYTEWNIIGWVHDASTDADTLGQAIPGTTVITLFDAPTQTFTSHVITSTSVPWDNFIITRGMGFFIYTAQNSTWDGQV